MPAQFLADLPAQLAADQAKLSDDTTAVAALQTKIVAAQQVVTDDTATVAADRAAIGDAVKSRGDFYLVNPDGTATAYEHDGQGGYTTKVLLPGTTPIVPPAA